MNIAKQSDATVMSATRGEQLKQLNKAINTAMLLIKAVCKILSDLMLRRPVS
jgi:hypothetical protein